MGKQNMVNETESVSLTADQLATATGLISARMTQEFKDEFVSVLDSIGMTTSQALKTFAAGVINCNGLPFQPLAKEFNQKTLDVINNPKLIRYNSIEDIMKDVRAGVSA